MALVICSLLVLVENDHCVSAGDTVKRNKVVPAPISPSKNSLVCTSLAERVGHVVDSDDDPGPGTPRV
jgi:hypothetical protein